MPPSSRELPAELVAAGREAMAAYQRNRQSGTDEVDAILGAVLDPHEAMIRQRIADVLRRAAAGRREYADGLPDDADDRDLLLKLAAAHESTAQLITDPSVVMDVIPSWRWTKEELASLYRTRGDR